MRRLRTRWAGRSLLLILGTMLILGAAAVAFEQAPETLRPSAGTMQTTTEEVRFWTPEDGWQDGVRTRTVHLVEATGPPGTGETIETAGTDHGPGASLEVIERVQGPAGPRGAAFTILVDDDFRVVAEPTVRAEFPPRGPFAEPLQELWLGVGWVTPVATEIGAIDHFVLVDHVERDGLPLVRYEAAHADQSFLVGETVWTRAVERYALVEPVTGLVVDYEAHETLWVEDRSARGPLDLVPWEDLPVPAPVAPEDQRKVWESTVRPTSSAQAAMEDDARDARQAFFLRMIGWALPLIAVGEVLLWGAIVPPRGDRAGG